MSCAFFFHVKPKIQQALAGLGVVVTMMRPFLRGSMRAQRFVTAFLAFASVGLAGTSSGHAAIFEIGDVFRAGFTTLTAPPDLAAAAALLGPGNNRTVNNNTFGEFSSGSSLHIDLNGSSINGFCSVSSQICGTFVDPAGANFFGLIISDTAVPGGNFENIANVTSSFLAPERIFFDANTIILDISGLKFASFPTTTQLAVVDFAAPTPAVPLPAALPLLASGIGALGLVGWRHRRKRTAAML